MINNREKNRINVSKKGNTDLKENINTQKKRSYSFYKLIYFDEYTKHIPQSFGFEPNQYPENPTTIKKNNSMTTKEYDVYDIIYDEKVFAEGYSSVFNSSTNLYENYPFEFYFRENKFKAFVFKSKGYVLFNDSYKITIPFLKSLGALIDFNGIKPKTNCEGSILLERINFEPMTSAKRVPGVHGAWWQVDNVAYLSSQATFGKNVPNSATYKELEKSGSKITSFNFPYNFNGTDYTLILSKNGSLAILTKSTLIDSLLLCSRIVETLVL